LKTLRKIGGYCIALLRRHVFTRENAWAILVSLMLLLVLLLGTSASQPRFVYGGF
jgi:hypothetical protein